MLSNNKNDSDLWQRSIKMISSCPVCGHGYADGSAKMFAVENNSRLAHIACGRCKSYFMAMIVMLGKGISTVGMVTDLSFEDVHRLKNATPITVDEIIDGFGVLFGEKNGR